MAATALWDAEKERLYLMRDRYGTKPLYIWRRPGGVSFASEVKAFFADPEFTVRVNLPAVREYFTFQNLLRDQTLFADVSLLPPGTILEVGREAERQTRYWDFNFTERDESIGLQEAVEETRRLLLNGIERQLVSDVPVGAYLSGGVDSGSLVAGATRHVERLTTFTAGFEMSAVEGIEKTFDERKDAELLAYHLKTEHYEQVINSGDIRWALPRVVWHLEDLRLGMSYPNYYMARLASKFVKVCLSGAGGDEIFAGYPWRYYRVFRSLDRASYLQAYYDYWQRLTPPGEQQMMFRPDVWSAVESEDTFETFTSVFGGNNKLRFDSPEDHIANALYFESKTFLHSLLVVGDKLSMAHGLEERVPFLDNALVTFVQKLPIRHKLGDLGQMLAIDEDEVRKKSLAEAVYTSGKTVLRHAVSGLLPQQVSSRPKQGFSAPDGSWYRGENATYVREFLLNSKLAMAEYIDPAFIHRIVKEHLDGVANHRLLIWSLLSFEWWCRIFLDGHGQRSRNWQ
jgi:asparagine synthase (glutamine-hydrolysing)